MVLKTNSLEFFNGRPSCRGQISEPSASAYAGRSITSGAAVGRKHAG